VAEGDQLSDPEVLAAAALDETTPNVEGPVDWRRNLATLWIAQFTAIFGITFVLPFLPVYLHNDLGVRGDSDLAFWTGLVVGASGFTLAVANPIWGMFADRFGRKRMVVRAMIGGGIVVCLMAFVQTPQQLLAVRLLLGAVAGSVSASTALVVAETPAREVGRALGIFSSGVAMGRTIGPLVGGVLASIFMLRNVFLGSGIMFCLASLVVIFGTRESARPRAHTAGSIKRLLSSRDGSVGVLFTIVAIIGLTQFGYASAQGLLVLRLLRLDPIHVQVLTGVAFAAGGLATALSASTYWCALKFTGYRTFAILSGIALAVVVAFIASAPSTGLLVAGTAALSLVFGALNPTLTSMVGIEAPPALKGTVLGLSQSASALGMAVGPLVTGVIASGYGVRVGLLAAAATALVAMLLMFRWGREPRSLAAAEATL
jgi:DHA1 family multidrug resistance protein-like MFS transporter